MKLISFLMVGALAFTACSQKNDNVQNENSEMNVEQMTDEHTSQNSLDWSGTYSGVEPCADCEGIKTTLVLGNDGNYSLTTEYLGKEDVLKNKKEGKFNWKDGNTVELSGFEVGEGSALFKVEENQLRHLDMEGNKVEGELADYYILKKEL